jgi:hypothetical protein
MKAKQTKTQKIIDWFVKHPSSDVKVVAKKFDAAVPMVYKLRKRAMNTDVVNEAVKDVFPARKITLNAAQVAIAKKFDIPLETFVKAGIANGTIQYDDEKLPVEDACEECEETSDSETTAVLKERGKRYGKFSGHARITQLLKNVMHAEEGWYRMTYTQREALEMVMHKVARMINGDCTYEDNVVDILGYTELMLRHMRGQEHEL